MRNNNSKTNTKFFRIRCNTPKETSIPQKDLLEESSCQPEKNLSKLYQSNLAFRKTRRFSQNIPLPVKPKEDNITRININQLPKKNQIKKPQSSSNVKPSLDSNRPECFEQTKSQDPHLSTISTRSSLSNRKNQPEIQSLKVLNQKNYKPQEQKPTPFLQYERMSEVVSSKKNYNITPTPGKRLGNLYSRESSKHLSCTESKQPRIVKIRSKTNLKPTDSRTSTITSSLLWKSPNECTK